MTDSTGAPLLHNWILDNTQVTQKTAGGQKPIIWIHDTDTATAHFSLTLQNGSSLTKEAYSGDNQVYCSMIRTKTAGNNKVTVDGTSSITYNYVSSAANTPRMFRADGALTVNVASGAKLTMNAGDGATVSASFATGSYAIEDTGATWTVNANLAKIGITLPTVVGLKNWKLSGTDTAVSNPYTDTNASGNVSFVAEIDTTNVIRVNGTNYDVSFLNSALSSATVGSTVTIDLVGDVTSGNISIPDRGLTIVINGNNKTWTANITNEDYAFSHIAYAKSFTVNDLTLNSNKRGFRWIYDSSQTYQATNLSADTVDVTFNNCTMTVDGSTGGVFELRGIKNSSGAAVNYNVTLNKTTVTQTAGKEALFYVRSADSRTVKIDITNDSHLTMTAPNVDNAAHVLLYSDTGNTTVSVSGDSTLTQGFGIARTKETMFNVTNTCTSFVLNLGKGAELTLNAKLASGTTTACSYVEKGSGSVKIYDQGATYITNADALKATSGVTLPTVTATEGNTFLGFACGDKLYKNGAKFTNTEATEGISATSVLFSNDDFNMTGTASMRLEDPSGIRFKLGISNELLTLLGNNVDKISVIIAPKTVAELTFGTEGAILASYDATKGWSDTDTDNNYLRASVTFDAETNEAIANLMLSARGCFKITYADNSSEMIYTANTDSANLVTVAELAREDAGNSAYYDLLDDIIALKSAS